MFPCIRQSRHKAYSLGTHRGIRHSSDSLLEHRHETYVQNNVQKD